MRKLVERRPTARPAAAASLANRPFAPQRAAPGVQRYTTLPAASYLKSDQAQFPSQSLGTGGAYRAGHTTAQAAKPDLKAAADGSLAIEKAAAQPKVFYASEEVVTDSNRRLEAAESPIRLVGEGNLLALPNFVEQTTWRMAASEDPQASIGLHICNEVASFIAGGLHQNQSTLVLQNAETRDEPETESTMTARYGLPGSSSGISAAVALEDETTTESVSAGVSADTTIRRNLLLQRFDQRIRDRVVTEDAVRYYLPWVARTDELMTAYDGIVDDLHQSLGRTVTEADLTHETSKRYGRLDAETKTAKSKTLGINQYAVPDVGEAVAAFPTGVRDYTGQHPEFLRQARERAEAQNITLEEAKQQLEFIEMRGGWTWHFAAAVAKSTDGQDYITLENYNRGPDTEKEIRRIHANLVRDFDTFLTETALYTDFLYDDEQDQSDLAKMRRRIDHGQQYAQGNWHLMEALQEASDTLKALEDVDPGTAWYFSMYGPAEAEEGDQSFHGAMAESGDFANPLTLRFRGAALSRNLGNSPAGDVKLTQAQHRLQEIPDKISQARPTLEVVGVLRDAKTLIAEAESIYRKDLRGDLPNNLQLVELLQAYYEEKKSEIEAYIRSQ